MGQGWTGPPRPERRPPLNSHPQPSSQQAEMTIGGLSRPLGLELVLVRKGRVCAMSCPSLCCVCESAQVARAVSDGIHACFCVHFLTHVTWLCVRVRVRVCVCVSVCLCELLLGSLHQSDSGKVYLEVSLWKSQFLFGAWHLFQAAFPHHLLSLALLHTCQS